MVLPPELLAETVTVAEWDAEPPPPVQVTV
jgi:hypothetical protein